MLNYIRKEGYPYIIFFSLISLGALFFSHLIFYLFTIILLLIIYFFRDPNRVTPSQRGVLVSPSDGIVTRVDQDGEYIYISIFLSIFDCHVIRSPFVGQIKSIKRKKGQFLNALSERAETNNERVEILVVLPDHQLAQVNLIAGIIGRRVVPLKKEKDNLSLGERIGIIKFSSRVTLRVPNYYKPRVLIGQKMVGGETILATKNVNN